MVHVPWARDLARRLLAEPLPRRWAHTQGVGRKAETIAHLVGDDADLLISAAWLHDIGYSPSLVSAGFHPLDGARYLRDAERADDSLCRLVAHHTYAVVEARRRGLVNQLTAEFSAINGLVLDALTYCDVTTDPIGKETDVDTRLDEIVSRYGDGDVVAESITEAREQIILTAARVQERLSIHGRGDQAAPAS